MLSSDPAKQAALCKGASSPFEPACSYGAGLTALKPPDLVAFP